jgi:hypothetical protein
LYFRPSFALDQIPYSLLIHTSGDNRYQLFVNGQLATWGPQRGDLNHRLAVMQNNRQNKF